MWGVRVSKSAEPDDSTFFARSFSYTFTDLLGHLDRTDMGTTSLCISTGGLDVPAIF
jgi:hypothetical protein